MSIVRHWSYSGDIYVPTCINCGITLDEYSRKAEALKAANKAGWKRRKNADGEWGYMCPDCAEERK